MSRFESMKRFCCVAFASLALGTGCIAELGTDAEGGGAEEVAKTEEAIGASTLVVMSLNARIPNDSGQRAFSARLPRIKNMINSYLGGAHLIGVQELTQSTRDQLAAALGTDRYWWYAVNRGDGEMITIFVRADRLEVLDYNYRNVSNGQRDDSCGLTDPEDDKNRPIQYVLVRDRTTGKLSYFYNTHYPSKNSCERYGQSDIFASYVASRPQPSARAILVGDFNDGVNADYSRNGSFQRLLDRTGFTSTFLKGPHTPSLTGTQFFTANGDWNKDQRIGKLIDHVLVSNGNDIFETGVDRSMFRPTPANNPPRVSCVSVTNGRCNENNVPTSELELYSDHWAVWASLRQ
jgi:endonuclease/exonuclease/phosphatase family metal-dependent hydrolase